MTILSRPIPPFVESSFGPGRALAAVPDAAVRVTAGVAPPAARLRAPRGGAVSPVNGRAYRGGTFMPTPRVDAVPARVTIAGFVYSVAEIPAGECGSRAFELHKEATNNTYHVIRDGFGVVACDCPDYEFRHRGAATQCKHGRRLVELGLIPAAGPMAWVGLGGAVSVLSNTTPTRTDYPRAVRRRPYAPTREEMAEAAQMFADLAARGDL